jgi:hypothetical protein
VAVARPNCCSGQSRLDSLEQGQHVRILRLRCDRGSKVEGRRSFADLTANSQAFPRRRRERPEIANCSRSELVEQQKLVVSREWHPRAVLDRVNEPVGAHRFLDDRLCCPS